jgi:hypothetical protein
VRPQRAQGGHGVLGRRTGTPPCISLDIAGKAINFLWESIKRVRTRGSLWGPREGLTPQDA